MAFSLLPELSMDGEMLLAEYRIIYAALYISVVMWQMWQIDDRLFEWSLSLSHPGIPQMWEDYDP